MQSRPYGPQSWQSCTNRGGPEFYNAYNHAATGTQGQNMRFGGRPRMRGKCMGMNFNPMPACDSERDSWNNYSPLSSPQPKWSRMNPMSSGYPMNVSLPGYSNEYPSEYAAAFNPHSLSNFEAQGSFSSSRGFSQSRRGWGARVFPVQRRGESAGRARKTSSRPSSAGELSASQLKLLEILNSQPHSTAEFKVLRNALREDGIEKKDINHDLYNMAERGVVKKTQNSPVIWQVTNAHRSTSSCDRSMSTAVGSRTTSDMNQQDTNINSNCFNNSTDFRFPFPGPDKFEAYDVKSINIEPLNYGSNSAGSISQNNFRGLQRPIFESSRGARPITGRGRAASLFGPLGSQSNLVGGYLSNPIPDRDLLQLPSEESTHDRFEQMATLEKQFEDVVQEDSRQSDIRIEPFERAVQLTDLPRGQNYDLPAYNTNYISVDDLGESRDGIRELSSVEEQGDHGCNFVPDVSAFKVNSPSLTTNKADSAINVDVSSLGKYDVLPLRPTNTISSVTSNSSAVSKGQSTDGFKVPLPPKQLMQVDPKFQATKINDENKITSEQHPGPSLYSTIPGATSFSESRPSETTEYHSLPINLNNLNVNDGCVGDNNLPGPRSGLQRCYSLEGGEGGCKNKNRHPFAVALNLLDDDDDSDDVSADSRCLSSFRSVPEQLSDSLPRAMSFEQIAPSSYGGEQSRRTASTSCIPTDSGVEYGRSLTSVVGWGGTSTAGGGPSITGESFAALNKNCISALMEYAQARRMEATIECIDSHGPSHKPKFKMAVFMGGRWFPYITCTNKKEGKKEAADVALRTLMSEGSYQSSQPCPTVFESLGPRATHFDTVASLAHQTFNRLAATVMESMVGKKVLGAFVMTTADNDPGTVISIGTGNRCITGTFLSLEGQTVNDSHAEIISRRGLIRFFYRQLLSYTPGHSTTIFEQSLNGGGKLKVKEGIKFHLYISTAPCGDGALFSPRDIGSATCEESASHTPTFANKLQGKLRTKMEGGEGTIPIDDQGGAQCWDGILRGERLRTMSCSDKVCRWNIVGLQGALLSHFLEPVYMSSLTLGFLYDHGHLSRAVCCRLSHGDPDISNKLPQGYRINHPLLGRVTAYDPTREVQKTKELSVNWVHGDESVELTDGTKGICVSAAKNGQTSQVAKCSLFESYHRACQRFNRTDLLQHHTYREAKNRAVEFRTANQLMCEKFKIGGHGRWVTKPVEEEMFSWTGVVP